jgi:DNA (cytosine-5)-methyltransferase 1
LNFYNDIDRHAAAWLRELIKQGHLPPGDVSETPIQELKADELRRYTQVHLFAGIGGWPLALQLAVWDPGRPVWTGSCPCQPFSTAGKRKGEADHRHLWPEMFRLIRECKPGTVFGEQVAGRDGLGWFDGVAADLESDDYAAGAVVLDARSFGCPQRRRRIFWVADAGGTRGPGQVKGSDPRPPGHWGWRGKADLQSLGASPFTAGDRWPQPLIRSVDDGVPGRLDILRGYGNAIVPQVAAAFVKAYLSL